MSVDPFARSASIDERVVARWVRIASVWSVVYLAWRAGFTLGGADAPAAIVLFVAEVLAVGVFIARARSASHEPIGVVVSPDAPMPDIAAVVDASGSSVDELRTTLVALRRVAGVDQVSVVDPDGSPWLRTVAERFGVTVLDASIGFDRAVLASATSWLLLLRSGDLPMPDLVAVAAPRCSAPDVAVIQVGVEEADPTTFEYDPDGLWSLEPFEQQIVRPSLAARGSVPWYGDGPVLVRRSAVAGLDSVGTGHLLDDSRRVGLDLIRSGMTVTFLPLTLARVRGPHGLGDSLVRRHTRSTRALRALHPRDLRGVPAPARDAHLDALVPSVVAVQRLLLVVAAVLTLGLAQVPMRASLPGLVALAVPGYLLRWTAHRKIGRGRLGPLSILRSDLRSLGVDLRPFGRLGTTADRAGLGSLVVMVLALDISVVVGAVSLWREWPNRLPVSVAVVAFVVTAAFVGIATEVLLDAMGRRQRRAHRRVRLGLVTCRIGEIDGRLVDLSTSGAGIVVPATAREEVHVGDVTTVAFRIPDADGAWRNVATLVRVVHREQDPDGDLHLGLAFDEPTDAPLDPVVEFLTVDRRLVALGRHESANL